MALGNAHTYFGNTSAEGMFLWLGYVTIFQSLETNSMRARDVCFVPIPLLVYIHSWGEQGCQKLKTRKKMNWQSSTSHRRAGQLALAGDKSVSQREMDLINSEC